MSLTTRYDEESNVLWFTLSGEIDLALVLESLEDLPADQCERQVWDFREMARRISQDEMTTLAGRLWEAGGDARVRCALLPAADHPEEFDQALHALANRVQVRFGVFRDPGQAIGWLTGRSRTTRGATILVTEDQDDTRELLAAALQRMGYRVVTAADGQSGWEKFTELRENGSRVDLLVADVVMPGVGGVALAERVLGAEPGTPIVLISGYRAPDTPEGAVLLSKPFGFEALLEEVRAALDKAG